MAPLSSVRVRALLTRCDAAVLPVDKGRLFEDLLCYVFEAIPGISVTKRDSLNQFQNEEIDIAFWNEKVRKGLPFLPDILLLEAKNWSRPISSGEIAWFDRKLADRGQAFGILITASGITGNAADKTRAHQIIATSLAAGRKIIVIMRADLEKLNHASDLVRLIKERLCELAVNGTALI